MGSPYGKTRHWCSPCASLRVTPIQDLLWFYDSWSLPKLPGGVQKTHTFMWICKNSAGTRTCDERSYHSLFKANRIARDLESGHKGVSKSQSRDSGPLGTVCHCESPPHMDCQASAELIRLPGHGPDWLSIPFPGDVDAFDSVATLRRPCCVWSRQQESVSDVKRPRILPLESQNTNLDLVILEEKGSTFLINSRHGGLG